MQRQKDHPNRPLSQFAWIIQNSQNERDYINKLTGENRLLKVVVVWPPGLEVALMPHVKKKKIKKKKKKKSKIHRVSITSVRLRIIRKTKKQLLARMSRSG